MAWFRLDDGFYDNPKVIRAGNAAIGLWVRCATYSARHLTDGRIPVDVVRRYGNKRQAETLIAAGLWTANGTEYVMHDYLEHNPSAAEVREMRVKRAESGRKGGVASGESRAKRGHRT